MRIKPRITLIITRNKPESLNNVAEDVVEQVRYVSMYSAPFGIDGQSANESNLVK